MPLDFECQPEEIAIMCAAIVDDEGVIVGLERLLAYYSSYICLVHVVSWIRRAVRGLRWQVAHQGTVAWTREWPFPQNATAGLS